MVPVFFPDSAALRHWFKEHHDKDTELFVGYYKVGSGKPSISWSQSVDEAICYGWIDGVRRSINDESYVIRFTPRKPKSIWSAVNIKKVEELTKAGLMEVPGIAAFEKREEKRSKIYAFEQELVQFDNYLLSIFKANKKAWLFFTAQAPSYQKTLTWRIMSAKQHKTKIKRLNDLIKASEEGRKIDQW